MAKVPAILEAGQHELAVARAADYFKAAGTDGAPFTGANFETLGHRWDDPAFANQITTSDLLALSTLSVPVEGKAAVRVLTPEFQSNAAAILGQVPQHASIGAPDAYERWLAKDQPMHRLWYLLSDVLGLGPVSVSKLMARKRAALVPIYDEKINKAWGLGGWGHMWEPMHRFLSEDGASLLSRGSAIARDAGVPGYVAPLRVLDAVAWHATKYPDWTGGAHGVGCGGTCGGTAGGGKAGGGK